MADDIVPPAQPPVDPPSAAPAASAPAAPVADLTDAGVPADQGLAALGMLMQLAGHILTAGAAFVFFMMLVMSRGSGSGNEMLWTTLMLAGAGGRSLMHMTAGKRLLYGAPDQPGGGRLDGVHRYVVFAIVQSLATGLIMKSGLDAPGSVAAAFTGGLLAWPVALAILLKLPRFAKFGALPQTEDKGFEGASILMTLLGVTGAIAGGLILFLVADLPGNELQRGPNMLVLLALIMLVIRSLLHVHAGVSGLRSTSLDRAVELTNRYANFGVISSFCAAGVLLIYAMASAMSVPALAMICGVCWLLLAWPLILRRFFAERQFSDLLAGGDAPVHRRAPDAGKTWLGWFLFGHALWQASFLIASLPLGARDRSEMPIALFGGTTGVHSLWWSFGVVVLEAWAGFELIRMSVQSRVVATAYSVVAGVVVVYLNWPLIQDLRHMSHAFGPVGVSDMTTLVALFGALALGLVIPVTTLVLVHRHIAPAARARYRPAPPRSTPAPTS